MVMGLMGHSSIAVTMDRYSHLFPEEKAAAVAKLDELWRAGEPDTNVVAIGVHQ